jgi:CRP-like cAMP-binding protein
MSNNIDEDELFYQDNDELSVDDNNIDSHLSTINTKIPDYGGIGVTSYKDYNYESEEAQTIIDYDNPPVQIAGEGDILKYDAATLFPDWIVEAPDWIAIKGSKSSNEISDILQVPVAKRTSEHENTLIHWLMFVWEIAKSMGFKKCGAMFKKFKYFVHEAGDDIMTEGESGYTFYIICSGEADIIKNGIGVVAHLGKGKCFGEIALTQGKTLRTATVRTTTTVEVLSLHKVDYDHFVKDLMQAERRENYFILKECKLFESWPRQTIEKMSSLCTRKSYEVDQYVFQQGDPPDCLYILIDGSFEIFKEITIICKNRWPTGNKKWSGCARKTMKPFLIQKLNQKSQYFGEHSIIKSTNRAATVQCKSKSLLLSLDKLEFLHFLERGKSTSIKQLESLHSNYVKDDFVLTQIGHIKGGPTSLARVGSVSINPQASDKIKEISPKSIKLEPIENHFKVNKTDVHLNFLNMNNPSEMLSKTNKHNNIDFNEGGSVDNESLDLVSLVQSLLVEDKKK